MIERSGFSKRPSVYERSVPWVDLWIVYYLSSYSALLGTRQSTPLWYSVEKTLATFDNPHCQVGIEAIINTMNSLYYYINNSLKSS